METETATSEFNGGKTIVEQIPAVPILKNNVGSGKGQNSFSCLNSDVVLVLDAWICQSVCLPS